VLDVGLVRSASLPAAPDRASTKSPLAGSTPDEVAAARSLLIDDLLADADGQEWREFARAWWTKFGPRWVTAGERDRPARC
jgi:hypothetical protein